MPITNVILSSSWVLLLHLSFNYPVIIQAGSCGQYNTCDQLISYSIFQKGPCGRAARCNWELLHLEEALEGNPNNAAKYKTSIKKALCNIPTLESFIDIHPGNIFNPCSGQEEKERKKEKSDGQKDGKENIRSPCKSSEPPQPDPPKYCFYPMIMPFIFDHSNVKWYLNRVALCREAELTCSMELQAKIDNLCNAMTDAMMVKLEESFAMEVRGQPFYKLVRIHPKLEGQKIDVDHNAHTTYGQQQKWFAPNKCALFHMVRQRYDSGVDISGIPTYKDEHRPNAVYPRLRGPFFDLHLLYAADPMGQFQNIVEEDRWWNETKAYQPLAHFLPTDMLNDIHAAIKCVYDSASSPQMEWKPHKFCGGHSTFVCVDNASLENNDCDGHLNTTQRHESKMTQCKSCV